MRYSIYINRKFDKALYPYDLSGWVTNNDPNAPIASLRGPAMSSTKFPFEAEEGTGKFMCYKLPSGVIFDTSNSMGMGKWVYIPETHPLFNLNMFHLKFQYLDLRDITDTDLDHAMIVASKSTLVEIEKEIAKYKRPRKI
jgi:hypothetical protein